MFAAVMSMESYMNKLVSVVTQDGRYIVVRRTRAYPNPPRWPRFWGPRHAPCPFTAPCPGWPRQYSAWMNFVG